MNTKLIPAQNGLRETTGHAVIALPNQQLADGLDFGLQARQAHWKPMSEKALLFAGIR